MSIHISGVIMWKTARMGWMRKTVQVSEGQYALMLEGYCYKCSILLGIAEPPHNDKLPLKGYCHKCYVLLVVIAESPHNDTPPPCRDTIINVTFYLLL